MQHLFLKNLNNTFIVAVIFLTLSCGVNKFVNVNLPEREARWAQVIEAQYLAWKRPEIKVNISELRVTPLNVSTPANGRQPLPIEQARFIPDSVVDIREGVREPTIQSLAPHNRVQQTNRSRYYTVKRGDVLSAISYKFYGKGSLWKKIYNANRKILKSPNSVREGQRLVIP